MANQQSPDTPNSRILSITRLLDAPRELVWEVWTNPEHIKNWWGPTGFTNTIDKMEVRPDGVWEFVMHGPDGQDFKNKSVFTEIVRPERLVFEHVSGPKFQAVVTFEEESGKTLLTWRMIFPSAADLENVVKVFKADKGLEQNVEKLGRYLETQFQLRSQLKSDKMARVSTYLNFPGNTEEAFNFYKSVFGGEFSGSVQRFGDIPAPEGAPALSEADKKLILHIELPIFGGHVLMATDAPESMGFKVNFGNNVYVMLEPDTRAETKRLFDALAEDGKVEQELQDMFWGAYYGSCKDKYGVQWMVNCNEKPA